MNENPDAPEAQPPENGRKEVKNGSRRTGKESVTLSGRELIQLVIFTPV